MSQKKSNHPPKWMSSLFVWLSRPAEVDDLLGDLEEFYCANAKRKSVRYARRQFFLQCIVLIFSYTVKKRKRDHRNNNNRSTQNSISMYINYLKMVLRGLRKSISFSLINILGLGLGLGVCFIILLYVQTELGYDSFHTDGDRIYRITKTYPVGEKIVKTARLRHYLTPPMKDNIPAVEDYCRLKSIEERLVIKAGKNQFQEDRVAFVDHNFFDFFSFELISGNRQNLLTEPLTMVISSSMSEKYFEHKSPLNEVMRIALQTNQDKFFDVKITGVFEDMPVNSHFHKDFLISGKTAESAGQQMGLRGLVMQHNYIKLAPGHDINEVNERLPFIEENYAPGFYKTVGMHLGTQALSDIHLRSNLEDELEANGNIQYVYLLSLVGLFILLIASFNYMNLATANALESAKEVGIRKVLGSQRSQLIQRFFTESMSMSFISFVFGVLVVYLGLPYFNFLSGQALYFDFNEHYDILLSFVLLTILVGFLAGLYPALYLSKFEAIKSLKGALSKHGKGTRFFRQALVVTQFVISAVLLISTFVVRGQLEYLKSKNLGFETDAIITIRTESNAANDNYHVIKQELLNNSSILAVAGSNRELITDFDLGATNGVLIPGQNNRIPMNYAFIDQDFLNLYGIVLSKGRSFRASDSEINTGIIINETAMARIGANPESIIGQKINLYNGFDAEVIGVVKDFHFESLHQEIGPLYFQFFTSDDPRERLKSVSVKIAANNLVETLTEVEDLFQKFNPLEVFEYSFMDDQIEKAYSTEKSFTRVFGIFSGLAVIMACLGILGLTIQTVTNRRKEIGVRKVLGASIANITTILTKDLLQLILLANVIAWPIAYLGMNRWLQDFPYRDSIRFEIFFIVLVITMCITLLSVISRSVKAALVNPTESLKSE